MYFKSSYFHNFRNLTPERLIWSPGFNLVTGRNGAGKTNFLEGLNLISGWGPLERGTKMSSLATWGDGGAEKTDRRASLWAGVSGEESAELFLSVDLRCSLKLDEKNVSASAVRSRVPVLSFLSDHLSLIRGSASHRRGLLDRVGSLISPSYAKRLHDYKKALRQKSVLLRRGVDVRAANRTLIPFGVWLWTAREELSRLIEDALAQFRELFAAPMSVEFVRGGGGLDDIPSADFKKSLSENGFRERASGVALVGPQRDDIRLTCAGREASVSLSRGQSRRAASALVLASAHVVERSLARKPVLVFDEIASELDGDGRNATFGALLSTGCQVFAATTDPMEFDGIETYRMQEGKFL
jgi:DNA replication and repair protein RecF